MANKKQYTLKLTEEEMKNKMILGALKAFISVRIQQQKSSDHYEISEAEYEIVKKHPNWVPLEAYNPTGKGKLRNEIGKFRGKKVILRK